MKLLIVTLAFLIAGFNGCNKSYATGLTDLKFGQAQIADSQWNVSACTQTATCQIYSTNPGTAYKIPWMCGWKGTKINNWRLIEYMQRL